MVGVQRTKKSSIALEHSRVENQKGNHPLIEQSENEENGEKLATNHNDPITP